MPEPTVVIAIKPTRNTALGISLIGNNGNVSITNIAPDGTFAGTDLKVGMEVESVNSTKCSTAAHAVALMREAEEHVLIVARDVVTLVVTKPSKRLEPSKNSKLGMVVRCSNGGRLTVASIDPGGPFAETELEAGMVILTVNGKAYKNYHEGYNMLSDATGRVTIRACKPADWTDQSAYTGSTLGEAFVAGGDAGDRACSCVIS